jgi:hypothetical protein
MKLNGDRNQCQVCNHYFNSSFAFDKHRTGDFGISRRCLSSTEMESKGMLMNANGFWVSQAMPKEAIPA